MFNINLVHKSFDLIIHTIYNHDNDPKNIEKKKQMGSFAYAKEISVIKVCLPRQMGNSSLLLMLLNYYNDSILLSPKMECIEYYNKLYYHYYGKEIEKGKIIHRSTPSIGIDFSDKIVLNDWSSFTSESILNKIYHLNAKFYVMVG